MYTDTQSIRNFDHHHARDRLVEAARRIGDENEAEALGAHFAGEREAQRLMFVAAIAAVGLLAAASCLAL